MFDVEHIYDSNMWIRILENTKSAKCVDKAVEIHFENIESPVLLKMAEWVSLDESLTFDNNFPQHMQ